MNATNPFDCKYNPQFAELLTKLNISLAISTYQTGKVIFISPHSNDKIIQLPRTFPNAMGMAVNEENLAVATKSELVVLKNCSNLAKIYPNKKNTYDSLYMPRATYHTGYLALHDMDFIDNSIVAVNTLFSCLSYINQNQSFTPFWQPPFISSLLPDDKCHLNGMAVENNEIKYLTALGSTDLKQGWRENKTTGGILMEYPSGKIILSGLSMPHSPRIYDGKLYLLNSAQGELIEVNPKTGSSEIVVNIGGFARGMSKIGNYLFIGVSKLRHNSDVFSDLPIAKTSYAGVVAVHLPSKTIVSKLEYIMSVDEIYDVKILQNKTRPNILNSDSELLKAAITFDDKYFWGQLKSSKEAQMKQNLDLARNIKIQTLKNVSYEQIKEKYNNFICKDFLNLIEKSEKNINQNLLIAFYNKIPVAMIVFHGSKISKSIFLNSIFVIPSYRNKGIATFLMNQLQPIIKQNEVSHIRAVFSENNSDRYIVERLLSKYKNINLIFED